MLSYLDCSRTCKEHVGAHVQGDLEAAIAMAQRLEVYCGGDGAKTSGKGTQKVKKSEKGCDSVGRREFIWGNCPSGPSRQETAAEEGQGWLGLRWKKDQEGRTKKGSMPQLWW